MAVDVTSISAMHVRIMKYLPRDLAASVHPKAVHAALTDAWDNGWRDPEWLGNVALEGTGHESVRDAAAVFMARLKETAAIECPHEATRTPPPATSPDPHYAGPPAPDDHRENAVTGMRQAIDDARRKTTTDPKEAA